MTNLLTLNPALAAAETTHAQPATPTPDEQHARRVAVEFEALLLTQLTSALNPSADNEEESLFGGGSGDSQLYRQMFSEQIAGALAKQGGVGLADFMMQQLGAHHSRHPSAAAAAPNKLLQRALSAARQIKDANGVETLAAESAAQSHKFGETQSANEAPVFAAAPDAVTRAVRPRRVFESAAPAEESTGVAVSKTGPPVSPSTLDERWRMPVSGRVSSVFGVRSDPFHGLRRFHKGVDIAAPRGTPIAAAGDGKVIFAGRQRGYGNTVIIEHADGRQTRYAHAEKLYVSPGEAVAVGQQIATVGSTGRSTGPHLHFEVSENGQAVNPLNIFANGSSLARR